MSYSAKDPRSGIDDQASAIVTETYASKTCVFNHAVTA